MKKKRKSRGSLRERLQERAQRRSDDFYVEPDPECRQIRWENLPQTLLKPMREHMYQKTVAAILVVISLGLFSLINLPVTNRLVDGVHYLTQHQLSPSEIIDAAKPVVQTVQEFNWRRDGELPPLTENGNGEAPAQPVEDVMAAPVNGVLASPYGTRIDADGQTEMHYGIDVLAEAGDPVYAALSGRVSVVKEHAAYGQTIYLEHDNNIVTIYGRVTNSLVAAGETVTQGQVIAAVAEGEGESHLHFEVWRDQQPVDPEQFFQDAQ
ncbi:M23 family metallopeptidase [Dethiobacter alkaliphilus]|uniref:Peptidase M23 n=1 Tax=Dethiobacter alkaliphilus AHT 1 TaxID=555088 RepID=C0GEV6_DETAL|nr:M23 family metallopeptidase [Dethiobacter alkaliphilus]EEG78138.1 Peptidase M23 [Dethiobacter alkaliphilus AHT 1]MCW3489228.1 M23 family metallopeptidase [Dethiobacter alkaliphilus]